MSLIRLSQVFCDCVQQKQIAGKGEE